MQISAKVRITGALYFRRSFISFPHLFFPAGIPSVTDISRAVNVLYFESPPDIVQDQPETGVFFNHAEIRNASIRQKQAALESGLPVCLSVSRFGLPDGLLQ